MAELQKLPTLEIPQLHGWAPALVSDHSQFAAIATQAGLLLLVWHKTTRSATASAAAASLGEASQQKHQDQALQSSNRELLSRGRELRGGVRSAPSVLAAVGPAGLRGVEGVERSLGAKAASSAFWRRGVPWGTPAWERPTGLLPWGFWIGALLRSTVWVGLAERLVAGLGRLPRR